ncbi:uncharacterized protein [Bemisia tabaci]|uniref:uncharacterized protein isoform X2 n=1 Tax=Bemisia tabaci TaxID=7038 RepID=UPI003B27B99B
MSKNSSNGLLRPSLKLFRLLLCVYFIPQTFGFLGKIDDESGLHSIPRLRPLAARAKYAVKSDKKADAFIQAMETFDTYENPKSSAKKLASSIKALLEAAGTTTEQDYCVTLMKYLELQLKSFPVVRHDVHGGGSIQIRRDTIDLVVQRADGVFFGFKAYLDRGHKIAFEQFAHLAEREGEDKLFYRGFERPATRTVVVGIHFTESKDIKFSFYVIPKKFKSPKVMRF